MNFSIVTFEISKDTVFYTLSDGMKLVVVPSQKEVTLTDAHGNLFTMPPNIVRDVIIMAKWDLTNDVTVVDTDFSRAEGTVVYTYSNGYTLWVTPKYKAITLADEKGDEVEISGPFGSTMFEMAKRDLETKALDFSKLKF